MYIREMTLLTELLVCSTDFRSFISRDPEWK